MTDAPIPEIEFYGGKRPREMTLGELLDAIAISPRPDPDSLTGRWALRLAVEYHRRLAQMANADSEGGEVD